MGKNYFTGPEEFIQVENEYEKLLEKNFRENEDKIKGDFKIKIRNLKTFYSDLNKKYNFNIKGKKELYKKLKETNLSFCHMRDQREESFIPLGKH